MHYLKLIYFYQIYFSLKTIKLIFLKNKFILWINFKLFNIKILYKICDKFIYFSNNIYLKKNLFKQKFLKKKNNIFYLLLNFFFLNFIIFISIFLLKYLSSWYNISFFLFLKFFTLYHQIIILPKFNLSFIKIKKYKFLKKKIKKKINFI